MIVATFLLVFVLVLVCTNRSWIFALLCGLFYTCSVYYLLNNPAGMLVMTLLASLLLVFILFLVCTVRSWFFAVLCGLLDTCGVYYLLNTIPGMLVMTLLASGLLVLLVRLARSGYYVHVMLFVVSCLMLLVCVALWCSYNYSLHGLHVSLNGYCDELLTVSYTDRHLVHILLRLLLVWVSLVMVLRGGFSSFGLTLLWVVFRLGCLLYLYTADYNDLLASCLGVELSLAGGSGLATRIDIDGAFLLEHGVTASTLKTAMKFTSLTCDWHPGLNLDIIPFEVYPGRKTPPRKMYQGLGIVYAWYCTVTHMIYPGSCDNGVTRGVDHRTSGRCHNEGLKTAIANHGLDAFYFIILAVTPSPYCGNVENLFLAHFNQAQMYNQRFASNNAAKSVPNDIVLHYTQAQVDHIMALPYEQRKAYTIPLKSTQTGTQS